MARCHRIGQLKSVTIYRLITRKSFEAEMFDRASKKLGLEQAILGSRQFDAEEYEESQKNNAKMDPKELEQLLREGAYAVLMEDNNEELKNFYEQDIDSILDKRTHIIREEKVSSAFANKQKEKVRKSIFTGESAMEFAEVDVNDPDFWKKVLPDLVTPDTMLQRLNDADMEGDDEEGDDVYTGKQTAVKKYFNDVSKMMEGILDLQRRGQLPERERAVCMKLLLQITLKEEVFDYHQRSAAQEWLSVLEGTRNRRRQDVDKYQPLPVVPETKKNKRGGLILKLKKSNVASAPTQKKRKRFDDEEEDAGTDDVEDFLDVKPIGKRGSNAGAPKKSKTKIIPDSERKRRPRSDIGKARRSKSKQSDEEEETKFTADDEQSLKKKSSNKARISKVKFADADGSDDELPTNKKDKRLSSRKPSEASETINLKRQLLEGRNASRGGGDDDDDNEEDPFDEDFDNGEL